MNREKMRYLRREKCETLTCKLRDLRIGGAKEKIRPVAEKLEMMLGTTVPTVDEYSCKIAQHGFWSFGSMQVFSNFNKSCYNRVKKR